VNMTMQLVTVCGTDELGATVPLKYFLCSTGSPVSLTPNGTFYARPLSYTSAQNPWYYFSLHNCWVLYCTQISGNICFHSLTFNQYGANSLSQSAYKALGNPASHGCIRLLVEDAKFIWENFSISFPPTFFQLVIFLNIKVKEMEKHCRCNFYRQLFQCL